jgi:prephenate dehydrogenase
MTTFRCVTIVGVGLIGGSIGLALRRQDPKIRVRGFGSGPGTLSEAARVGAITEISETAAAAVADADLIIVCAPVSHIVDVVRQLAPACRAQTILTDAGSTKLEIVGALENAARMDKWPAGVEFIGSHPIAGNEKRGPLHARADLFEGRAVVITPTATSTSQNVARLKDFWTSLGARVVEMDSAEHDQALAATSHLPHLVAAAIAGTTPERYVTLTAGGWQDTTRIAGGDPGLWRQILLSNRDNVLTALAQLRDKLEAWRIALENQDAIELERLLTEAKRIRDAVGS